MPSEGWYWGLALAGLLIVLVLILVFRRGGLRIGAEAFGAKLEVEGKGGGPARDASKPDAEPAVPRPAAPSGTQVRGRGNIAVGGNVTGTFVAGEHNWADGGRERG